MAALTVPTNYDSSTVLIVDDEPQHIEFLIDYVKGQGLKIVFAENAEEALDLAQTAKFRAYFIDLNIPTGGWTPPANENETFKGYRGLHVIQAIRSQGNDGARVLAYSAHFNHKIFDEIERLYCKYVAKGNAKELKDAIKHTLSFDPKTKI